MLQLADFDDISMKISILYSRFAADVIEDIARRLTGLDMSVPTAMWQAQRLMASGQLYEAIIGRIISNTVHNRSFIEQLFLEYGIKSIEYDNRILQDAGVLPLHLNISPAMLKLLRVAANRTAGILRNFTLSSANVSQYEFINAADLAFMHVSHGTMSYGQAIKAAIKKVAQDGIHMIHYPSGHKDQLDVAARRAVLSGVGKAAGDVQILNLQEQGVDLIQVSAHIGARNKGDLPENHEMWQGRVYTLGGDPRYPDFFEWTGYGTGPGLSGWNCRHSFYPFYPGISENPYTREELLIYKHRKVTYNGEEMSFYDATQVQRSIEREIRAKKREAEALGVAGLDNWQEREEVKQLQAKMRDFIKQTQLDRQYDREGGAIEHKVGEKPKEPEPYTSPLNKDLRGAVPFDEDLVQTWSSAEDPGRRHGMFDSERVQLSSGDYAIKKVENYSYNSSKNEAAAYELDQMLGLNIVPETVFSDVEDASFQMVLGVGGRKARRGDLEYPGEVGKLRLLDILLGNHDRHSGNWRTHKGHLVAVDNGLVFWNSDTDEDDIKSDIQGSIFGYTGGIFESFYPQTIVDKYTSRAQRLMSFWSRTGYDYPVPIDDGIREKLQQAVQSGAFEAWMDNTLFYLREYEKEGILARAKFMLKYWDKLFVKVLL